MITINTHGLCDPIRVRPGIDHESVIIWQGTDTVIVPVILARAVLDALTATVAEVSALAPAGVAPRRDQLHLVDAAGYR